MSKLGNSPKKNNICQVNLPIPQGKFHDNQIYRSFFIKFLLCIGKSLIISSKFSKKKFENTESLSNSVQIKFTGNAREKFEYICQ